MNIDGAINIIQQQDIDTIITDLNISGDGSDLFQYLKNHCGDIPVIFLTAYGTKDSAASAFARGAFCYFIKPPDYMKLKEMIAKAVERRQLKMEIQSLKELLSLKDNTHCIIGSNHRMRKVIELIEAVKDSLNSILIQGETGTGKELIAKAVHYTSRKKTMPFIVLNCAAIPKELMESELFGYEKGAFTGAFSRRIGKCEKASGGTLFLDEIGELEISLQTKLLRVLQERELVRLGSNNRIKVNFRLICSTNKDIKREVSEGRFREDLFYRINAIEITLPPLRERKDDIPLLISKFVNEFCIRENKRVQVSKEAMEILQEYVWPWNIRQLRNIIERAVVVANGNSISIRDLPEEILSISNHKMTNNNHSMRSLKEMEIQAIRDAIKESNGNKSKAAKMLGISRTAFYKRLREITF